MEKSIQQAIGKQILICALSILASNVIIAAGIMYFNPQHKEILAAIEALQPAKIELEETAEADFYLYRDLVRMTIKEASGHDKDPNDFSYEDQKELVQYLSQRDPEASNMIIIEGHPIRLKARWPQGQESLAGIYLELTPSEEKFIHFAKLLDYCGYDRLGDWIVYEEQPPDMSLGGG